MRQLTRTILGTLALVFLVAVLVVLTGLRTYAVLSEETLIAELSFEARDDGGYNVRLSTGDRCSDNLYAIYGDQWRIDAQFIKWKYWANLLGADGRYRLERLEGRYHTAAAENSGVPSAHDLSVDSAVDLARLAEWLGALNPLFDAAYGSSTYHSIDTDRLYQVYKTQVGIIARSEPALTPVLVGDYLDIEIDKACGRTPSTLSRLLQSSR